MCILFIHTNPNPEQNGYRLIAAANRDEYFNRPAATVAKIDGSSIFGGQDLKQNKEGGMWLGITTKEENHKQDKIIRFGAILNLTGDQISDGYGRGIIVKDYLESDQDFLEYVKDLEKKTFSGYNFIAAEIGLDATNIYHHSNMPPVTSFYPQNQTLGFGNSPINVPYQKVLWGRHRFQEIVKSNLKETELVTELVKLLKESKSHLPDYELQRRSPVYYKFLSSIFVKVDNPPVYGTRTHSIILVDYNWDIQFIEHSMKEPIDGTNPEWIVNKILAKL